MGQLTEIVWICSPDRVPQLRLSLGSLFRSGSSFDSVAILCVGGGCPDIGLSDPRIRIVEVGSLYEKYFYGNKAHLCGLDADRIVFLDADTLVLRPLNALWEDRRADFLARVATSYEAPRWNAQAWREACDDFGSAVLPMYNAGVLVFQHGSHRRIGATWNEAIRKYLSGDYPLPYPDERMPEQFALSLALGRNGISRQDLGPTEHGFGWIPRPEISPLPVVFHTGTRKFEAWARKLGVQ